jgi:WXXGXW repeat (2 copies)
VNSLPRAARSYGAARGKTTISQLERRVLDAFLFAILRARPRIPEQPDTAGKTRDDARKGVATMRIIITTILTALIAVVALTAPAPTAAQVRVGVAISIAPPALPVYEQPICPGDGYLWTPGYWAWNYDVSDYYWVPGTWVEPPEVGFLWTPGYWGWTDGAFAFNEGYWGPTIGFYGGINYGFGYFGVGFSGGRWDNGHFFYNRSVSNVNVNIVHNVYNQRINDVTVNHVSFNGGNGGVDARPTAQEEAAAREQHVPPVAAQTQQVQAARGNPELRASANHGKPPIAATDRAGTFDDHDVVKAKDAGAPYHAPAERAVAAEHSENNADRTAAVHPKDLPAIEHPAAPNTGDAKLDQKYQQQQDKLVARQQKERQQLQQQQDKEHEQLAKQKADSQRTQQIEQKHQQETQEMAQRHTQQMQDLQRRQQPQRENAAKPRE